VLGAPALIGSEPPRYSPDTTGLRSFALPRIRLNFYSGYSGEWAYLVAGPRSVGSDGYPLGNPAKTEAQAGLHAPLGNRPMLRSPWRHARLAIIFYCVCPRPLRACTPVVEP
jgi:hypothetical protein